MRDLIRPFIPPIEPAVVYHYTSLEAMMNILKTQTIRASDIGYLNDVSERNLLLDMVDQHIVSFATDHGLGVEPFRQLNNFQFGDGPFVASFSAEGDSLNQWRSYCPIANGVSIGFKTECVKRAELIWRPATKDREQGILDVLPGCVFKAISYVEPNEEGLANQVMNLAYREAQDSVALLEKEYGEGISDIDSQFRYTIEAQASFYKHKGFRNEMEYRLVLPTIYQQTHLIEFRPTRSSMVPFVSLRIPHSNGAELMGQDVYRWDSVSEIVIGPTPNVELTRRAVWGFCRSIGLASANVTTSELPYRDW